MYKCALQVQMDCTLQGQPSHFQQACSSPLSIAQLRVVHSICTQHVEQARGLPPRIGPQVVRLYAGLHMHP
jgi:hypothetical protein